MANSLFATVRLLRCTDDWLDFVFFSGGLLSGLGKFQLLCCWLRLPCICAGKTDLS